MGSTERLETLRGLHGQRLTKNVNSQLNETDTGEIKQSALQISMKEEIEETQTESSGASLENFGAEGFHSVNLLKKSANRLMDIMQACVSETDLEKAKESIQNLEMHKVEMAIKCANGIQQSIQTQVNILKVAKELVKLASKK
jgi:hypothetical protein